MSTKKQPKTKKLLSDVLAIDVGGSATKLVRIKSSKKKGLQVIAVGTEAAVDLRKPAETPPAFDLPRQFCARYAAMSVSGKQVLIRMISIPGNVVSQGNLDGRIREQMHLDESYRIGHTLIRAAHGKTDGEFIVVGLPEEQAANALSLFEAGPVAPVSLEASGLGALRAFDHSYGSVYANEAVAVVETGMNSIYMGIFSQGKLSLLRTFNFGESSLIRFVQNRLSITREEAQNMIHEGSFDLTDAMTSVMRPFFEQINLSKDYIERRDKLHVREICLSGGMGMSKALIQAVQLNTGMPVKSWNPFEGLDMSAAHFPDELKGHECRFASAVGSALNALVTS